jgi:hypothetical protein
MAPLPECGKSYSSYCYGVTKRERAEDEMSSFKPDVLRYPTSLDTIAPLRESLSRPSMRAPKYIAFLAYSRKE